MSEFRLDPRQVEETFAACLIGETETDSTTVEVKIETIVGTVVFSRSMLGRYAELIAAMLLELPTEFRMSDGGGWSFLQGCMDRHGTQWTGFQGTVMQLFALGMGIGMVECQLPREVWSVLPGGVPYYAILDTDKKRVSNQDAR